MPEKEKLIADALKVAEKVGLHAIVPVELSNGGNLILHLAPHPIVARIATVQSRENPDLAYKNLDREVRVARHLRAKGVPVLLPSELVDAGPYDIGGTWMTLWAYVPPAQLESPSPSEAVACVNSLSLGLQDFPDDLPLLGVWERTCRSANRLMKHSDPRIRALLKVFVNADRRMRLEPASLVPSHGDAHRRNLLPSPRGWIWSDFEDLSLMPAYWDLASYVANLALFGGVQEPTFTYVWSRFNDRTEREAFGFAVGYKID